MASAGNLLLVHAHAALGEYASALHDIEDAIVTNLTLIPDCTGLTRLVLDLPDNVHCYAFHRLTESTAKQRLYGAWWWDGSAAVFGGRLLYVSVSSMMILL